MKKIMFNDKYGLTQAVLEGRKTQTRRIANISRHNFELLRGQYPKAPKELVQSLFKYFSKFKLGEIVAVAQKYKDCGGFMQDGTPRWNYISNIVGGNNGGWFNKMFIKPELMPHQIRITNIRIERLQDISDEDCLKEGIVTCDACGKCYFLRKDDYDDCSLSYNSPREAYAVLIDKVGKKGDWERNPFVFVYDFELVK